MPHLYTIFLILYIFFSQQIFLVCHGFSLCRLPCAFTHRLSILLETPCTFFEEITQSTYNDRRREIAVKLAVPACAETIEEQQKFVCLQVIKLSDDDFRGLGELVPASLSLQTFKIAKLIKLGNKRLSSSYFFLAVGIAFGDKLFREACRIVP